MRDSVAFPSLHWARLVTFTLIRMGLTDMMTVSSGHSHSLTTTVISPAYHGHPQIRTTSFILGGTYGTLWNATTLHLSLVAYFSMVASLIPDIRRFSTNHTNILTI